MFSEQADINNSITSLQQAVDLTPRDHSVMAERLEDLGKAFVLRFWCLGERSDINSAIAALQRAVTSPSHGTAKTANLLSGLAYALIQCFHRFGERPDLDRALETLQRGLELTRPGDTTHDYCLRLFTEAFGARLKFFGAPPDLDGAVKTLQDGIELVIDSHPGLATRLNILAAALRTRFERFSKLGDLHNGITHVERALSLATEVRDRAFCLYTLGILLAHRFDHYGELADIEYAIVTFQQGLDLAPQSGFNKAENFSHLANAFMFRFDHFGELADVDRAISNIQQAIDLTPVANPSLAGFLSNLGGYLNKRFQRLGELNDLYKAVESGQQAIDLIPNGDPSKAGFLLNLGVSFMMLFERSKEVVDIRKAIATLQQSVDLRPDGDHRKAVSFTSLGDGYLELYKHSRELADINKAVAAYQQAIDLTPDSHGRKARQLVRLGSAVSGRFRYFGELADVDKAIALHQQAVSLTPEDHADYGGCLEHVGISFSLRFKHLGEPNDQYQALIAYSEAARSLSSPPYDRFNAARQWAGLSTYGPSFRFQALEAYTMLIELVPRVAWLGQTVAQRFKDIASLGDVISEAAAEAIHVGKLDLALEWLEQGRSIVWGQVLQLRTPIDDLRQHYPTEAQELERVSHALESAGTRGDNNDIHIPSVTRDHSAEQAAQAHRRLAEDYDRILRRIRTFPDFTTFLEPKKLAELRGSITSGPVIIVNIHETRCDVLVLRQSSPDVTCIPLSEFHMSTAQSLQRRLAHLLGASETRSRKYKPLNEYQARQAGFDSDKEFADILKNLWTNIAEPILGYLNHLKVPATGEILPHVTWCMTGPLSFLPIHAAGLYDADDQPKISDFVVSSYTPTLTALLNAKAQRLGRAQLGRDCRVLGVSQPSTAGQSPLPQTCDEIQMIQNQSMSVGDLSLLWLDREKATVKAVLDGITKCNWIHLACHGTQDPVKPTDSAFLLADGKLTLQKIMEQSFTHTELAILSACQTATGDQNLPEEAIHLAAGMLAAGYGSVVATMWSIFDNDAPLVAESLYSYLMKDGKGDSTQAAYALHDAVARLRKVRGEKKFAKWVPFIHLGI